MTKICRFVMLVCTMGWLIACGGGTTVPQSAKVSPTTAPQATDTVPPTGSAQPTVPPLSTVTPPASPSPRPPAGEVPAERIAAGQAFAERFLQRDYAAVLASFDDTMKSVFPEDKVKEARESLEPQLGAFMRTGGTRTEQVQQSGQVYDIVYVTWEFEKATIELRIVYNQDGQVAGLFFQPAQGSEPTSYIAPDYVDSATFRDVDVTVGSGEWALPGTLSLPVGEGPFPALVLVHGSGPNDRDETVGPNKPFRDLAWGLASHGIAVLRYEKRTRQHAALFTEEVLSRLTSREETTDDALAAVALLRQTEDIDPAQVFVLGHSLGGYLVPRIGASDPQIAGLIVMAGPTRPLEDLMLEQFTYLYGLEGGISADEQASLDEMAVQAARVKDPGLTPATNRDRLPLGTPASFWLDVRGYDPAEAAKELGQPLLILQGARDYQVTTTDLERWKASLASRPDAEIKLYPDLNHLFMPGTGKSTPAEYETPGHVAEPVIAEIASWILKAGQTS